MTNKSLTDLVARTATALSDLLHINSGGTDYKQTKQDFLNGDFAYTFANDTAITTQADALGSIGQYTGKINSYGHQAATGMPRNNSFYVTITIYSANYKMIVATDVDLRQTYVKYKINGTWDSDWRMNPTRSEVDTLSNSFVRDIDSIAAGSSKTYTLGNSSVIMLVLMGTAQSRMAIYNIYVTSAGAVYVYPMVDGSNITITNSTNSITIANTVSGSGLYVHVSAIVFKGSISG